MLGVPPRFEPPAQPFPLMSRLGAWGSAMSARGRLTLGDLFPEARGAAAAPAPVSGLASDSRKVEPGSVFFAVPGTKVDGTELRAAGGRGRRRRRGRRGGAAARSRPKASPIVRVPDVRRALALAAAALLSAPAARRSSPSPGTSGKSSVADFARQLFAASRAYKSASLGTLGVITSGRRSLWLADDAGPDHPARDPRPARAATASRASPWRLRPTASTSAGSTASASRRRASPISAAIISIITARPRPMRPPSCACSTRCSPGDAPAVVNADGAVCGVVHAAACAARTGRSSRPAARARRCGFVDATHGRLRPAL